MEVRLDRALTTSEWLQKFPIAKLYNLECISSDHNPILLVPQASARINAPFRYKFENTWMSEPMCEVIVKDGWTKETAVSILEKIKTYSQNLAIWGKEVTGNFNG